MSEEDEKRWQRHMKDESVAISAQQETAGDTHSPLKGPGLHGDFALNAVAKSSADETLRECMQRLGQLVAESRARGERAVAIDDLQALIDASRNPPKEPS